MFPRCNAAAAKCFVGFAGHPPAPLRATDETKMLSGAISRQHRGHKSRRDRRTAWRRSTNRTERLMNFIGTAGNDTLTGTSAADSFDIQQGGQDKVSGGAGDD